MQRLGGVTPSGLLQRHRAGTGQAKGKAASLAHVSPASLDGMPSPAEIQRHLAAFRETREAKEAERVSGPISPISHMAESSSGLGTESCILPRPRQNTGDIGAPPEGPPALVERADDAGRTAEDGMSDAGFFTAHACWLQKSKSAANLSRRRSTIQVSKSGTTPSLATIQKPSYTLDPTGVFRNFWDCLGIFLLLKDSIALPLQFLGRLSSSSQHTFGKFSGDRFSIMHGCSVSFSLVYNTNATLAQAH